MILGQEPGEQHPVPVLVGQLLGEVVDRLFLVRILDIARLIAPCPEHSPEPLVLVIEVGERLGLLDRPLLKRERAASSAMSRAWMMTFSSCRR